ncbi:MAG: sigma-54 dependent transcriptional regulator [Alphaproteobacteria bacterium]|nr:sigma-54 dependent transcriptional regulator [Alphaproteobacteria bacterium]
MSSANNNVLIVEDSGSIAVVYESWLTRAGFSAQIVESGEEALEMIRGGDFRVVLLDLQLPDISGLDVLDAIASEKLGVTVVVVTASGSIMTAVDAMRRGAYDFVVKPAAEERLVTTTRNAMEREVLQKAVSQIRASYAKKSDTHGFIGNSLPMIAVYKTIDAVAQSNASVFITGESGTGKELCAEAIHKASPRKKAQFVALNCAAIPKDLIESEIFGHLKGAFTGATSDRDGAAMAANGGTLFLDEVCEMDIRLQSKLLRFLQTGTVQKVGSDKLSKVDVRIVCATNRDPVQEVEEGRFREDLFYRLHVVPVLLPPLRERGTDVVDIARDLLTAISAEEGKAFAAFASDAEDLLLSHRWPGNVRELQNVIRNAVILNDAETLEADMLNIAGATVLAPGAGRVNAPSTVDEVDRIELNLNQSFAEIEREIIEAAIVRCGNSIPKASQMLDLSPSTIYRKKESWEDE